MSPADASPPASAAAPAASESGSGVAGQVVVALILLAGVSVFAFKQSQSSAPTPPTPVVTQGGSEGGFHLGLQLEVKEDFLVVREALEKGNAARSGVRTGDRILAVGGKPIAQEGDSIARSGPILAARSALREGDTLTLTLQRPAAQSKATPTPGASPSPGASASESPAASASAAKAWGDPFTVVVSFVGTGGGFEPGLAKSLIAKGAVQLPPQRRLVAPLRSPRGPEPRAPERRGQRPRGLRPPPR